MFLTAIPICIYTLNFCYSVFSLKFVLTGKTLFKYCFLQISFFLQKKKALVELKLRKNFGFSSHQKRYVIFNYLSMCDTVFNNLFSFRRENLPVSFNPTDIYLFKVKNGSIRAICKKSLASFWCIYC